MKKPLKNLSLKKLNIAKLTVSDQILGGSGDVLCRPRSEPLNNCPPPATCLRSMCNSCVHTHQANGC